MLEQYQKSIGAVQSNFSKTSDEHVEHHSELERYVADSAGDYHSKNGAIDRRFKTAAEAKEFDELQSQRTFSGNYDHKMGSKRVAHLKWLKENTGDYHSDIDRELELHGKYLGSKINDIKAKQMHFSGDSYHDILEIPKGKNFWELNDDHYKGLVSKHGKKVITDILSTIMRDNKHNYPHVHNKAEDVRNAVHNFSEGTSHDSIKNSLNAAYLANEASKKATETKNPYHHIEAAYAHAKASSHCEKLGHNDHRNYHNKCEDDHRFIAMENMSVDEVNDYQGKLHNAEHRS